MACLKTVCVIPVASATIRVATVFEHMLFAAGTCRKTESAFGTTLAPLPIRHTVSFFTII